MITRATLTIPLLAGLVACGEPDSVTADRYSDPDRLFSIVDSNVASNEQLEKIVEIDHSRLGAEAGSVMPPARVLLFSNPALESQLVAINPLIAVDLPMRVLAYEMPTDGSSRVIHNSFDYLSSRYGLDALPEIEAAYSETMSVAIEGIGADQVTTFTDDSMQPDGITTLESPFDFEETVRRVTEAIDAQDDTVWFGRVDFQARAQAQGIEVSPTLLLLFGAPAPGAKGAQKFPAARQAAPVSW